MSEEADMGRGDVAVADAAAHIVGQEAAGTVELPDALVPRAVVAQRQQVVLVLHHLPQLAGHARRGYRVLVPHRLDRRALDREVGVGQGRADRREHGCRSLPLDGLRRFHVVVGCGLGLVSD